jgi:tRNA threonylcarbamoyl adenosine modification protein YeaZ
MRQLVIDTSTEIISLALADKDKIIAQSNWHCRQNHTRELLPRLISLLSGAAVSLSSIEGIVIARGPGSFNGLRVGMSTAKGLAFALSIPIVGISSLEATAYQYAETDLPICPIRNVGREEIATALYQRKDGKWCRILEEHITTIEALMGQIKMKTLFCGELSLSSEALSKRSTGLAIIPPGEFSWIGYLAELGSLRLEKDDFDDLATLQPLYLRRPPITQPKVGPSFPSLSASAG